MPPIKHRSRQQPTWNFRGSFRPLQEGEGLKIKTGQKERNYRDLEVTACNLWGVTIIIILFFYIFVIIPAILNPQSFPALTGRRSLHGGGGGKSFVFSIYLQDILCSEFEIRLHTWRSTWSEVRKVWISNRKLFRMKSCPFKSQPPTVTWRHQEFV